MTESLPRLREQLRELKQLNANGQIDDAAFDAARLELETRVLDSVLAAPAPVARRGRGLWWAGAGLAVLALAGAGYAWKGAAVTLRPASAAPGAAPSSAPTGMAGTQAGTAGAAPHSVNPEQIDAMVGQLVARLQARPDDAEGWSMLGRTYMAIKRYAEAVAAYERLVKLRPADASTLADYADALAVKGGGRIEGEPAALLESALKLEPNHLKALVLSGTAAFNRGDFAVAVTFWDRAVQAGPPDSPMVAMARGGAVQARERGKLPAAAAKAP